MIKMWDARNQFDPKSLKIPLCKSISALKYNGNGNMVASAGTDLCLTISKVTGNGFSRVERQF
jgi:hypothetical protein